MFNFEKLNVYKETLIFIDLIYKLSEKWPSSERYILVDQLIRAATSVALNIAEGSSRTSRDFQHFISISRGSIYECVAILTIALNRKYITKDNYDLCYNFCNKLARMLSALKNSLN